MMAAPTDAPARGLVGRGLIALAAFLILIGLGIWQLERRSWKEGLIDALERKLNAAPVALPAPSTWPALDPEKEEFRRVRFSAEFWHEQEALVHTTGSSLRTGVAGPGYWVFTPARLVGGAIVAVNRGAVPDDRRYPD